MTCLKRPVMSKCYHQIYMLERAGGTIYMTLSLYFGNYSFQWGNNINIKIK